MRNIFYSSSLINLVNETKKDDKINFLSLDRFEDSSHINKQQEKNLLYRKSTFLETSQTQSQEDILIKNEGNSKILTTSIL